MAWPRSEDSGKGTCVQEKDSNPKSCAEPPRRPLSPCPPCQRPTQNQGLQAQQEHGVLARVCVCVCVADRCHSPFLS